ncbi:MAG: N-acetyl-gamma-glutamyl-phosphate reductase [Kangiellaceae bacterium]|jgi:N-acetyl-gamma-glutamyl-phosphate reductase|nr:N-acetyl-gamma-glutamyl-phosphate reductase [Kangiellaceae bacterium]
MSKIKVSIIGGAGYGSAEILRHLLVRDDVEILRISSKDYIGQPVSAVHRALVGYDDLILEDISPKECVKGADIVFLAMPHIITAKVAMELFDEDVRIIDLSGDFRLNELADYIRDYAPEHPCPERLGTFTYGMPELNEDAIKTAQHVASPGCFATGIAMGLLPLADAGLLKNVNVRNVSMTGSSGSGVKPQAGTHHAIRVNNLKAYKTLHHQHRAEIIQTLKSAGGEGIALDFVPVSAPLVRGILAVSQLDLPDGHDAESIQGIYKNYYGDHKLVTVMPINVSPEVVAVSGTARVEIGITVRVDEDTGVKTLCVTSAIDNLIKGGAGQAIQSFNLMTNKPMHFGLDNPGMWP